MAHVALLTLWERQLPNRGSLPTVKAVQHHRLPREAIIPEDAYAAYGYINDKPYERPEAYVRWIQPNEEELSNQVEYDMDEQDLTWLKTLNEARREGQLETIPEELFEIVMDRLEKEWFDLSMRSVKPQVDVRVEDSICEICNEGDAENANAIVFCDGCNLAVHQDCYGVPYIPEGQWLCRKCTISPHQPVSCVLCPVEAGAFKQTTNGLWAHLLCAIFVPEVGVQNTVYMEPIDGVDFIPKTRWKLHCYLCRQRKGAPIQCAHKSCFTAFHASCAREYGLPLQFRKHNPDGYDEIEHKGWCHRHVPSNFARTFEVEEEPPEEIEPPEASTSQGKGQRPKKVPRRRDVSPQTITLPRPKKIAKTTANMSRAHSRNFLSRGPPLVPQYIFDRVFEYTKKLWRKQGAKVASTLNILCRYWSLKKEARRGATLLKRLHLEPWTASASRQFQSDLEKEKKLTLMKYLREDLGKVSDALDLVRKREATKLQMAENVADILNTHLLPLDARFRDVLSQLESWDKENYFLLPVTKQEAPDYHLAIKKPMSWRRIRENLENTLYLGVDEFKRDVEQIFVNARLYNPPDHLVHKAAVRLAKRAEPVLLALEQLNSPDQIEISLQAKSLLTEEHIYGITEINERLPWMPPKVKVPKPPPPPPKNRGGRPRKSAPAVLEAKTVVIDGDVDSNATAPNVTDSPSTNNRPYTINSHIDLSSILPTGSRRGGTAVKVKETAVKETQKRKPRTTLPRTSKAQMVATDLDLSDSSSALSSLSDGGTSDFGKAKKKTGKRSQKRVESSESIPSRSNNSPADVDPSSSQSLDSKQNILAERRAAETPTLDVPTKRRGGRPRKVASEEALPEEDEVEVVAAPVARKAPGSAKKAETAAPDKSDKSPPKSASYSTGVRRTRGTDAKMVEIGAGDLIETDDELSVEIPAMTIAKSPHVKSPRVAGRFSASPSKVPATLKKNVGEATETTNSGRPKRSATAQPTPSPSPKQRNKRGRTVDAGEEEVQLPPAKRQRKTYKSRMQVTKAKSVEEKEEGDQMDIDSEEEDDEESAEQRIIADSIDAAVAVVQEIKPFSNEPSIKERMEVLFKEQQIPPDKEISEGDLVWAKTKSYPWWPCEVSISDSPNPEDINDSSKIGTAKIMVMYFEPSMANGVERGHQFVTRDKLRELGQSTEFDDLMCSQQPEWANQKPTPRLTKHKKELATALRIARALMETPEDVET